MASMASVIRTSTKLVQRQCRHGFRTSARSNAAQNFPMPALSPTMTEGNIASWKVKEGESFSAGDVLLEIETDKAQMDVEAQDDGKMFKIIQADGTKAIKVGARIAVLAEAEDDLSALEMPKDDAATSESKPKSQTTTLPREETSGGVDAQNSSESQAEAPSSSKASSSTPSETTKSPSAQESSSKPIEKDSQHKQRKYPLYPSVQMLLHHNNIPLSHATKITATGPNGRLLKGDVLAYMGSIQKDYSASQSKRLERLGHMDLSNIKLAEKPSAKPSAAKEPTPIAEPQHIELALPVSFSAVIATQKRVQDTLGINLPLSVFVARASELANEDLPKVRRGPTSEELFNSVLGLDKITPQHSRGHYFPSIANMHTPSSASAQTRTQKVDGFDDLIGSAKKTAKKTSLPKLAGRDGIAAPLNVFSVSARKGEEKRVQAYLERMKLVLEGEPGRLVL